MRCPFLREEQIKSCHASPFRKLIARSATQVESERCSSPDYVRCPAAIERREAHPNPSRCPFLEESLVQFCAAAPSPTYVPWSDSPQCRCCNDGHRFCDLFLAVAGAGGRGPARPGAGEEAETFSVEGVLMPGWLHYSANHLWLDVGDDGLCHLGVDAFLAHLVGPVERLAFLTLKGKVRPAVVLGVGGVDLTLVFPEEVRIVTANTWLRSSVDRIEADPYGRGWLFEARDEDPPPRRVGPGSLAAGALLRGPAAREWMRREVRRATEFVHEHVLPRRAPGEVLLGDGGTVAPALVRHLDRDQILQLFATLFPLDADTRRPS